MLSCHRAFAGISCVRKFFSWVFPGSKHFSRGYFMGPKLFLVGISWVKIFLSWVFHGSKYLNISFLMGISWVRDFFSWVFHGFNFSLMANFLIQRLSIAGCMRKSDRKRKYVKRSQTVYFIPNRFQQLSFLFTLEKYFIFSISYAIMQLSVFSIFSHLFNSRISLHYYHLFTCNSNRWLLEK